MTQSRNTENQIYFCKIQSNAIEMILIANLRRVYEFLVFESHFDDRYNNVSTFCQRIKIFLNQLFEAVICHLTYTHPIAYVHPFKSVKKPLLF